MYSAMHAVAEHQHAYDAQDEAIASEDLQRPSAAGSPGLEMLQRSSPVVCRSVQWRPGMQSILCVRQQW